MEAVGILLVLLSIPLVMRWVPPNHVYGFRVPSVFRDRSVWYDVNAAAGWHFIALGAVMVTLEFILPGDALVPTLLPISVIGLTVIIIADWRLANRLERERRQ